MRGTTATTANKFKKVAGRSRSATDGNKNLNSRARRKSASSQVPMGRTSPIKGPDKGTG